MTSEKNQRIDEIEKKLLNLEWDKKHSKTNAKNHIYERLKEELKKLKADNQ